MWFWIHVHHMCEEVWLLPVWWRTEWGRWWGRTVWSDASVTPLPWAGWAGRAELVSVATYWAMAGLRWAAASRRRSRSWSRPRRCCSWGYCWTPTGGRSYWGRSAAIGCWGRMAGRGRSWGTTAARGCWAMSAGRRSSKSWRRSGCWAMTGCWGCLAKTAGRGYWACSVETPGDLRRRNRTLWTQTYSSRNRKVSGVKISKRNENYF